MPLPFIPHALMLDFVAPMQKQNLQRRNCRGRKFEPAVLFAKKP